LDRAICRAKGAFSTDYFAPIVALFPADGIVDCRAKTRGGLAVVVSRNRAL
jgi:hypothetical protein